MKHIDLTELLEFSQIHHVKKDIIKTAGFNAVLICLEKGQEIHPYPEPYYVLFHVLEGQGIITAGAELYHVKQGHIVYVESNDIRGIKCTERMSIIGIQQPH
ncbi:MAG: cupin domain-containing protein [Methanosarcina sp.]